MSSSSAAIPLLVASIGILGTLAASISTQVIQGHREREHYERDRQAVVSDRWLKEQQDVFIEFLSIIEPWRIWARSLRYSTGKVPPEAIDGSHLDERLVTDRALTLIGNMALIADDDVAHAATALWMWTGAATACLADLDRSEENRNGLMSGLEDSYKECVRVMRTTLGFPVDEAQEPSV